MDDVAERAGVSRALVSLVMRSSPRVSPRRRAAVQRAAEELGYLPHLMARGLASRKSTVIAVLVSDLRNPYFAEIVEGADARAREDGFEIILGTGGRQPGGEQHAVETLLSFRPAGLVLLSPVLGSAVIERAATDTPVVAVERTLRLRSVDTVNDDGRVGSGLAVDHLVELGHTRVVHLDGGQGAHAATRRRGFVDAMQRHGLNPRVEASEHTEEAGAASVRRLLATGESFTALVAANDVNAIGALGALADAGLVVPDDVSVVGYDNTSLSGLRHIWLTTVNQPRAEMGRLAVEALVQRIREGRAVPVRRLLEPSLVVRGTTSRPSPGITSESGVGRGRSPVN
jgi:DNA-binding LacI/PurR family transcriptional regulator